MGAITHANDLETFENDVLKSETPVIVDFWATWCGPCHMVAPELEALASERDDVKVVKVDVDLNPEVAGRYDIRGVPTIGLFRGGEMVGRSVGAKPRRTIESELGLAAAS